MTVDSVYFPVVFVNDGDVEYTVELESIGDVFEVYKVPDDGSARTLLTEDFHYTVRYEEHLDPIKKRALITLAAPLSADSHLEVFRKTTIANPFTATALTPFEAESFEYALDRICFIQQEIEGHLCDCRGDTYPPPVVPPLPPECEPYSCDSFVAAATAAGLPAVDFRGDFNRFGPSPIVMPDPPYFTMHDGSVGTKVRFQASAAGQTLSIGDFFNHQYFAWPIDGQPENPDLCNDFTYGLGLGENTSANPSGPKLWLENGAQGVALMHHDGLSDSSNGRVFFQRTLTWTIVYPGGENGGGQTGTLNWFISEALNNQQTLGWWAFSTIDNFGAAPWVSGANYTYFEITAGEPYLQPHPTASTSRLIIPVTAVVKVNDNVYTVTRHYQASVYGNPAPYFSSGPEWIGETALFSGCEARLYSLVSNTAALDYEDIYLWYKQNFADYEPPGTCPTITTETNQVSSTPPVQDIFD